MSMDCLEVNMPDGHRMVEICIDSIYPNPSDMQNKIFQ